MLIHGEGLCFEAGGRERERDDALPTPHSLLFRIPLMPTHQVIDVKVFFAITQLDHAHKE